MGFYNNEILKSIAGVAGNVLEWYDFAIFGYFADEISIVFFPPDQVGNAALIESFAVFGGAFLMRPVGGILMGWIGDKYGRKRALEISLFLMAVPTFIMGCLPSYAVVGPLAFVLLILTRLLQGLSVGGQLVSSMVFTVERHPHSTWGFHGSTVLSAANFGTLLGSIVAAIILASLTTQQLIDWGWRLPFLSGVVILLAGVYLRFFCDDEAILHHEGERLYNPLKEAFRDENRRALAASVMVAVFWNTCFYLTFVWMATYMEDLASAPLSDAFTITTASLFLSVCCVIPFVGHLSDKCGRRRIMTIGYVLMACFGPFMVIIIGKSGSSGAAFAAQSFLGVAMSLGGAPSFAWMCETFDPVMRLTSVGFGYNLAQWAGGMTTPLATYMVDASGNSSPGILLTIFPLISLVGLWLVAPGKLYVPKDTAATESPPLGKDLSLEVTSPLQQQQYPDDDDGPPDLPSQTLLP